MTIITCIDDNGGILFNHRRVSRDSAVIKDIEQLIDAAASLYIRTFSEDLFADVRHQIFLNPDELPDQCVVFLEDLPVSEMMNRVDRLIIYRWNRKYPSDFQLDIDLSTLILESTEEIIRLSEDYFRGGTHGNYEDHQG